jgi:hypothetical protein
MPQAYSFSSSNVSLAKQNFFEHEESDSGEQLLRPLIYALTGDVSKDSI